MSGLAPAFRKAIRRHQQAVNPHIDAHGVGPGTGLDRESDPHMQIERLGPFTVDELRLPGLVLEPGALLVAEDHVEPDSPLT
jgi:hypothetical protein